MAGHRLIKTREIPELLATCYEIDGTDRLVLELHMFGFAYSSYFLLLRSRSVLEDPDLAEQIGLTPARFGKKMTLGIELERDPDTEEIYFNDSFADPDSK
jgi:hypothetical protein